jgi:hypothetical protein
MPVSVLYPEWYDQNEQRKYPFTDASTLTNGDYEIPEGALVDAHLYPIDAGERQFLSTIEVAASLLTFEVSDGSSMVCSGSFNPIGSTNAVEMTDEYDRPVGVIVVDTDQASLMATWPLGRHVFTNRATSFVSSVVHPMPSSGVRGLRLATGQLFTGDVWIVGGEGVVLSVEDDTLRVDVPGDPYYIDRRCQEINAQKTEEPRFLKSINGIGPNIFGNLSLTPGSNIAMDNTFRVVPIDGGARIELVGSRLGDRYVQD